MNEHVIDVTEQNAQQVLLDESSRRLVLVDFWADWCAPCKALMPVLEKLANEYAGKFLLAKVNADQQQMIAGQFGVRSLPTVILMKDGQPVDAFQGVQPEQAIRELLDTHLPKPWDAMLAAAQTHLAAGAFNEALPLLRQAYEASTQRTDIALALAHTWLQLQRTDEAEAILKAVPIQDRDAHYEQLMAQLELRRQAGKAPEIEVLEQRLKNDPDNHALACQLAVQLSEHGHHKDALENLLAVLRADLNFQDGGAKKIFLDVLAALGKGDPMAVQFQRKFFTLLH